MIDHLIRLEVGGEMEVETHLIAGPGFKLTIGGSTAALVTAMMNDRIQVP